MPCDWPVDRTCFDALPAIGPGGEDDPSPEYATALAQRNAAEDTAVLVLWRLTGERFGICPTTVRPCPTSNPGTRYGLSWSSFLWWNGAGWQTESCGCAGRCITTGPGMVHLPGPVSAITKVTIGDVVLDPTAYRVEGNVLYRTGGAVWPSQNLGRPVGDPNTWVVEYDRGEVVPPGGALMAALLTKEFMAACSGSPCRLPKTVVSTTRQGVTHQFDPTKIFAAGLIGIAEIDHWIHAINPHHLMRAPSVI